MLSFFFFGEVERKKNKNEKIKKGEKHIAEPWQIFPVLAGEGGQLVLPLCIHLAEADQGC